MGIKDRSSVIERARGGEMLSLELGCGPRKVNPSAIGVDLLDADGVDLVGEIFEVLAALPDGCAGHVYSAHFFEHVADLRLLLTEVARVMRPEAQLTIVVPHFSNPFYYSDPTHRVPFGLYTMSYFCKQDIFRRTIPSYGLASGLRLRRVSLHFKSYPPRYFRHAIKCLIGLVFDANMYLREFYEENLCWLIPCYEIRYELERE